MLESVRNALGLPVPDKHWSQELQDAGLSLMGRHDELDYFSDDSEPDMAAPMGVGLATRVMSRELAVERLRMARRARIKGLAAVTPIISAPSGPVDLLAGILDAQTNLLSPSTSSRTLPQLSRNPAVKPRPSPQPSLPPPARPIGSLQPRLPANGEVGGLVRLTKAAAVTGGGGGAATTPGTTAGGSSGPRYISYGAASSAGGSSSGSNAGMVTGRTVDQDPGRKCEKSQPCQ